MSEYFLNILDSVWCKNPTSLNEYIIKKLTNDIINAHGVKRINCITKTISIFFLFYIHHI